jgi:uncharacterized protein
VLAPRSAWAKFVPPPLTDGHVVTMVGWVAPYDVRKINEEAEIARIQTGYVIDVLLAPSDDPIEEITAETFQAWKPGDPAKDNGLLLVIQPNFPRGQRKVRLQVGKGVEGALSSSKASDILRNRIGPLLNGGDEIRTAIATGVLELANVLGADESAGLPDGGAGDASTRMIVLVGDASAASAPLKPASPAVDADGPGSTLWMALGGFAAVVLGYVGFMWMRGRAGGKTS